MSIILFLVILVALILVHEFGHFIVAKKSGIRVDEFGIGFPPKLFGKKYGETEYTVNALPFGGFVKIFGEDPNDESISGPDKARSFVHKPKLVQIAVLAAGVVFNIIFAWLLISVGFMIGMPTAIDDTNRLQASDVALTVVSVVQGSPAAEAMLVPGDQLVSLSSGGDVLSTPTPESVASFIGAHANDEVAVTYVRGGETATTIATPRTLEGVAQPAIGIAMSEIGTVTLNPFAALYEGAILTGQSLVRITVALAGFIASAFTLQADLSTVAGPVGIVNLVGEASALGLVSLLSFTAFISLHLAIINILPFPALDGGRILFVLIESIKGSPIKPAVANTVNAIGFALLILLMVVVTISDITKLF